MIKNNLIARRTGFTLIELLVVLALVAMVVGLVAQGSKGPILRAYSRNDMQQFVADFQLCRTFAMNHGIPCFIQLDDDGQSYQFTLPAISQDTERKFQRRFRSAEINSIELLPSSKSVDKVEFATSGVTNTMVVHFLFSDGDTDHLLIPGICGQSIRSISLDDIRSLRDAM